MARPISGAPMATVIEVLSPQMALVSVSRPSWSVPSRWRAAGAGERGGQVDGGVAVGGDEGGQDPHQQDHHGYAAGDQSAGGFGGSGTRRRARSCRWLRRAVTAGRRAAVRRSSRHALEPHPGVDQHVGDVGRG